jgi:DNA-binding SARP family transcriptional activator/Tfp pilus assembly protein PilF
MAIRLETLGGVKVFQDGAELIHLPRQRLRCALLVHLAVQRSVARERLLQLLWGDPERSKHTLSQMLYELRQKLGHDCLDPRADQVLVGSEVTSDAVEFADAVTDGRLDEAALLYRGAFLEGSPLADTYEFELWAESERTRLASLYRECQRTRLNYLERRGHLGETIAAARRWVLADPMEDEAHLRLIRLLARSGQRNEALRQYEEYRVRLAAIDQEPLESIAKLVEELRSGSMPIEDLAGLPASTSATLRARTGIVVLPIRNISDDPSRDYFCAGLAEEITHALGSVPGLRVVPRTSARAVAGPDVSAADAALQLGVTHALEGSVRFDQDRFRVKIALIDSATDTELWSGRFDDVLGSASTLDLQDRIAGDVLRELGPFIGDAERKPRPVPVPLAGKRHRRGDTRNPDAHVLFLRGRHAWYTRTLKGLETALELFEQAVRLDPDYARAHAAIADVHCVLGGSDYSTRPPQDLYPRAREAAERALELEPDLAEGHAALGNYFFNYEWDWSQAEEHLVRAIDLSWGYSGARQWYSNFLMVCGREDEAIAEATLALELDPRSVFLASSLGRHFQLMRNPRRAVEQYRRALEQDPSFASAQCGLAIAELQAGNVQPARERLERLASAAPGTPFVESLLGYVLGVCGESALARSVVQRLKATPHYLPPELVAVTYVGLGEMERALDWLDKAFAIRSQAVTLLKQEPIFDPLRGNPRFGAMLHKVGLA